MQEVYLLKLEILALGAKLSSRAMKSIGKTIKRPISLRSGLSSGIDIILPQNVWVNAPIKEGFVKHSNLYIDFENGKHILRKDCRSVQIMIPPEPLCYSQQTSDGIPLRKIGSLRGDRLSIGIDNSCIFWNNEKLRCKFCAIGSNIEGELRAKSMGQILEAISIALSDPVLPAKHIYLNCGAQPMPDSGMSEFAKVVQSIKTRFNVHVHLNPCPPKQKKYVDLLHDTGLDEISFNIDIFDPATAKKIIPGKYRMRESYLTMLEYAVKIFGETRVSSCLVVGLEPANTTVKGVDFLCSVGVVPKLSAFRPLAGSLLANTSPPSYEFLLDVYLRSKELTEQWSMPLGPLCPACQLHSLVLPTDSVRKNLRNSRNN